MVYTALLEKKATYLWGESLLGRFYFSAKDDEEAKAFVATIIQRMNKIYRKMNEPRDVCVMSIDCLIESGYSLLARSLDVSLLIPLQGYSEIRTVLEAFYPKTKGRKGRSCITNFTSFTPAPCPQNY